MSDLNLSGIGRIWLIACDNAANLYRALFHEQWAYPREAKNGKLHGGITVGDTVIFYDSENQYIVAICTVIEPIMRGKVKKGIFGKSMSGNTNWFDSFKFKKIVGGHGKFIDIVSIRSIIGRKWNSKTVVNNNNAPADITYEQRASLLSALI